MSLCNQINDDLSIFFDLDEMGSLHTLQGKQIVLIVDNDLAQAHALKAPDSLYDGDMIVFVRKIDLPKSSRIEPDMRLVLDSRPYCVLSVLDLDGILQITLTSKAGGF